jgi:mono/diheme cytochrome c family protein
MSRRSTWGTLAGLAALAATMLSAIGPGHAQQNAPQAPASAAEAEPVPKFDAAYLSNPDNIKVGQRVWTSQCRHCHGASAYPGKAPKLNPGNLEPDFIFDRVTNGFGKMPPWKHVFTLEERKAVVAFVKSDGFSP